MNVHFSSASNEWPTPQGFFDELNEEFRFTLDPAATADNAKCPTFFTIEDDGLSQSWNGHRVFCNPPYGRGLKDWVRKAHLESLEGALVVLLIPARTDTGYFHDYILDVAELRFIRGRLKFGGHKNNAPFPSMIAVFHPFHVAPTK